MKRFISLLVLHLLDRIFDLTRGKRVVSTESPSQGNSFRESERSQRGSGGRERERRFHRDVVGFYSPPLIKCCLYTHT